MTLHDFLFQLALLIISFAIPLITTYVVQFLATKSGNEKFKGFIGVAQLAVSAIEQSMVGSSGAEKKKAVELFLANRLKGITVDEIDKIIEAAVFEMNLVFKSKPVQTILNNNTIKQDTLVVSDTDKINTDQVISQEAAK